MRKRQFYAAVNFNVQNSFNTMSYLQILVALLNTKLWGSVDEYKNSWTFSPYNQKLLERQENEAEKLRTVFCKVWCLSLEIVLMEIGLCTTLEYPRMWFNRKLSFGIHSHWQKNRLKSDYPEQISAESNKAERRKEVPAGEHRNIGVLWSSSLML